MLSGPMKFATALGLAGVLPFLGCAWGAVVVWPNQALALLALLAYGACILSFLGAVHWGFVLSAPPEAPAAKPALRLALGTVPSLVGWVALVCGAAGQPLVGLGLVLVGLLATALTEAGWTRELLVPLGYFKLRVVLSTLVALTLAAVLAARILGIDF